ncbi:MAG: alpha/beta hydrolase [Dehalococcoidia bacterium]|nr:alpha/beta hydrolase [Dehalococcoidia bacterium]
MGSPVPVRDIFVQANGLRHHLVARGAPGAPAVLMIHGLAGQAHAFDAVAARLASRFHVYCLDVRGRGESEWGPPDGYHVDNYVADLEAVREALGLERVALVGTSMGGIVAMNYAPAFPERVSRVVLNDIGPEIDPRGLQRIVQYVGTAPEAFPDMAAVVRYYRDHYGPMVEHLPEDQVAEFARWNVRRSDSGVYVWKMDPAARQLNATRPARDPWEAFSGVQCPLLVLRGASSDILSAEIAVKMASARPGMRLVEVPNVGHAPLLTEPVAVQALSDFLNGGGRE